MRVALLDAGRGAASRRLASAGLGRLVAPPAPRVLDTALRARKLGDRLAGVPPAWLALRRGGFDLAHAFSVEDALATAAWRGPLVLTIKAPPQRSELAARRGRLSTALWALARADVVLAADAEVAAGLARWLGVEAGVLAAAKDHAAVYAEAVARFRC